MLAVLMMSAASQQSFAQTNDYDTDNDNLIEVRSLEQLNAIRYDLDGDGTPTSSNMSNYADAFPTPATSMGCPATCTGYELMADLDFDTSGDDEITTADGVLSWGSGFGWEPIGTEDDRFTAEFHGNDHTISHLFINRPFNTDFVGLFGDVGDEAVIRSVGLVGVDVTGDDYVGGLVGRNNGGTIRASYATGVVRRGDHHVGGLVGLNAGTIDASYATGEVGGNFNVGGLVGYNNGTIRASYATGEVNGRNWVGGLVGQNNGGTIRASYATGEVNGSGSSVGGLVGTNDGGTIRASYATGEVNGSGSSVGGLVGTNDGGTIRASYATGEVNGSINNVGGLVGGNNGTIEVSYATGEVNGSSGNVGGLVGQNNGGTIRASYATGEVNGGSNVGGLVGENRGTIRASYATGEVNGTDDVGGLVGENRGTIRASYATGEVNGGSNVGGLVGRNSDGTIIDSYFDTDTSGLTGSEGRATGELQLPTTYTGIYANWNVDLDDADSDFNALTGGDDPWHFGTSEQYPVLQVDFNGDGVKSWQEFGPNSRRVAVSPRVLSLMEGEAGTYTVVLLTTPTDSVTVTPMSDNPAVSVSGELTFSVQDWNVEQTVTVRAVNDDNDVDEVVSLTHTVESEDLNYALVTTPVVTVNVADSAPPTIIGISDVSLETDAAAGTEVSRFTVSDEDDTPEQLSTFMITLGGESASLFVVTPTTGTAQTEFVITLARVLARAPGHDLTLTVTANDGVRDSEEAELTVMVANLPPTALIAAPTTSSLVTGQVIMLDASGSTDTHTGGRIAGYEWRVFAGDARGDELLSTTNTATTEFTAPLELMDAQTEYVIALTVTDGNDVSSSTTIALTVYSVDLVNTMDSDNSTLTGSVNEGAGIGDVTGLAVAVQRSDGHRLDVASWSLPSTNSAPFMISSAGEVTVAGELDHETSGMFIFNVTAMLSTNTDLVFAAGAESRSEEVEVTIGDVDEPLTITDTDDGDNTIAENTTMGTVVENLVLLADDPDADNDVTSLTIDRVTAVGDSAPITNLFGVTTSSSAGNTTASLTVAAGDVLDHETVGSYDVTIMAVSQESGAVTATFTVMVTDVNEAPTVEITSNADVADDAFLATTDEAIQLGSVVMDQDVGDGHRYNWVATPSAGVTLSPSDGIITAFTAIQAGDYLVRLTVTDNDGLSAATMVTVRVGVENSAGICGRTRQVQEQILFSSSVFRCDDVTGSELASVLILFLGHGALSEARLRPGDFQGLSGLLQLALSRNGFTTLPDGIFSELVSLKHLGLSNNELTSLPDGIFSGLGNLRYLGLWNNELTTLPDGIFSDLTLLKYLALESNRLTSLSGGAFTGLTSLKELVLNGNGLSSLSADVFTGLVSLQDLLLHDNALTNLPAGVFTGLDSLRRLNLSGNPSLTNLEVGVFDDVLDTLRSLYLDDVLKRTVSFSAPAAGLAPGATVMVSVQLDRALPARVRVPYSVSFAGGAAGDFDGLADGALDFNAGETSRAVRVTASETATPGAVANLALGVPMLLDSDGNANTHFNVNNALAGVHRVLNRHTLIVSEPGSPAPSEIIAFTAVDASSVADGRAIDLLLTLNHPALAGTPVTIAYTIAATGGVAAGDIEDADADGDGDPLTGRIIVIPGSNAGRSTITTTESFSPEGMKTFTVSLGLLPAGISLAAGEDGVATYVVSDICGRTRQVYDAIVQAAAGATACGDVTSAHLAGITSLNLVFTGLQTLQAGDFAGLINLVELFLNDNSLTGLPDDVFSDLTGLQELNLERNRLTELPAGVFNGLTNLRELRLINNSLTDLPAGVFTGLASLEDLRLRRNSTLTSLPVGVFSGLTGLEYLDLSNSGLTSLPDDVFSGLTGLEVLLLHDNDPTIFPVDAFAGLTRLEELWWRQSSGFPADLFDDVLDTLVQLIVAPEIRSALSFDQSAAELGQNAPVEVDVTLSRALPAAVRVSYALSFGGGADASHFSDDAGGVLTFTAGQTRTSVTVTAMANAPVDGTARLTLGAPVLLDGDGEASPLHASALVVEGSTQTHTITVVSRSLVSPVVIVDADSLNDTGGNVFGSVAENEPSNTTVGITVEARRDGNTLAGTQFALVGSSDFQIDANSGVVTTTGPLDYEALSSPYQITITVMATPLGETLIQRQFVIAVTNVNETPTVEITSNADVADDAFLATTDEAIQLDSVVMDQDVGDGHRYNWVATPPAGVTLSPSDGITTAFTAIQAGDYLVRLTVTDNGGLSASAMVTVRVGVEDSAGICGRTQQVQDRILSSSSVFRDGDGYFNREDCDEVTPAELASVSILFLRNGVLSGEDLQPGDFQGLSGLLQLALSRNGFTTLPDGIFSELVSLKHLGLSNNGLASLPDGIFSGLGNLRYLGLWNNELTTLPDGIFSDLTLLKYLALESNRLTSLSGGAFTGLTSLKELVLNGNGLSSLSADVFTGLVSLQDLLLHDNALMNLPAGVFTGLDSLRRLNLSGNPSLTNLEVGVFDDVLDTLRSLYLDDVLKGTLSFSAPAAGLAPGATVMVSVQLDRALPARVRVPYSVSFAGGAAGDFDGLADGALDFNAGETSRAVRVTASETATPGAVANLALGVPMLLDADGNANTHFNVNNALAGVHRVLNRHTLIVSDASAPSEVIEFTADDAGNAVDGTAIDLLLILNRPALVGTTVTIPYTIAATGGVVANDIADADADGDGNPLTGRIVVNPGSNAGRFTIAAAADFRPNGMKTFTVSLGPLPAGLSLAGGEDGVAAYTVSDICGRTRQVRDAIVQAVAAAAACGDVTPAHLAGITSLNIGSTRLQTLQAGDFAGLINLVELFLNDNSLTGLPDDVFSDLTGLQELNLERNRLTELPAGVFNGLTNLRELRLINNSLTDLPAGVFTGLASLEDLRLRRNSTLTSLPVGVFSGLTGLEYLDLSNSGLTSLPDDVFSGLTGLEVLLLHDNDPTIFPVDAFAGLTRLEELWWRQSSGFPADLFDDVLDTLVQLIVAPEIRSALSFDQSAAELGQNAPVEVDVTLSRALPAAVRVSYALSFGGGADASHFSDDAGGVLTFTAGQTRTSVTVTAMANAPVDGTARLTLGAPVLLDGDGEASPLHASALVVEGSTQTHTITVVSRSLVSPVVIVDADSLNDTGGNVFGSVAENEPSNTTVGITVEARRDGNTLAGTQFALVGSSDFQIDANSGVVTTTGPLDYEALSSPYQITITVMATPLGETLIQRQFVIAVTNVNETPTVEITSDADVADDAFLATTDEAIQLGSVVMDQDIGDGHRYNWVATPPAGVTLSPSDGITTAFIAIQAGDYLVRLTVTDNGGLSASTMVTVRVGVEDSAGICGRTRQVQEQILFSSSVFRCDDVTGSELASVLILFLGHGALSEARLRPGDFQGLSGLLQLALSRNGFTTLPDGIFSELVSLKHLGLSNNELTSLPDGIFSGLGNLRYLGLWNNELTTLPDGIFSDLTLLKYLALESNRLTSLSGGAFTGLTSLKELVLNGNGLSSLSADVFTGLVSLQDLLLHDNALTNLPAGVFTGLDSLRRLNLSGNPGLTSLEAGVFDDVLDTLRSLYLDDVLKRTVSFSAPAAGLAPGATVMVSVQLDRALPARVRVPYSVSFAGGAAGDFDGLADGALDFNAGETSRAVRVTASETATPGAVANLALGVPMLLDSDGNANTHFNVNNALAGVHRVLNRHTLIVSEPGSPAPSEIIAFTAVDASSVADGRAIDLLLTLNHPALAGTPVTIAYTIAATGGVAAGDIEDADADGDGDPLTGRIIVIPGSNAGRSTITTTESFSPEGMKTFTVSLGLLPAGISLAAGEDGVATYVVSDICGRTRQVYDAIVQAAAGATACGDVTSAHLAGITSLNLVFTGLQTLQAGDFAGLINLVELFLNDNSLTGLPDDVFSDLTGLQELNLERNRLTELPAGVFNGLTNLRELRLINNSLTDLPAGVFTGLASLEDLRLRRNSTLTSLPVGVFSGLTGLEYLDLSNSGLTSLPDDVFSGLTGLEVLLLHDNDPTIFPVDAFAGLTRLEELWWRQSSGFPADLFDDVLDTLVQLIVAPEIRSALSFDQSAAELGQNAPVEVDVTLSRALPAAVRVSYALSFGGGADASHFSDDAGGVLTFTAGQTRTSVTVTAMANAPVDGTARLTLGAPVLLDGDGEASPLHASALVVEGSTQTHTITVVSRSLVSPVVIVDADSLNDTGGNVFGSVAENEPSNTTVGITVEARRDGNTLAGTQFALVGSSDFQIDANSGVVTTTGPLDYEALSSPYQITITVMATPLGETLIQRQFVIAVTNVNETPTVEITSNADVADDAFLATTDEAIQLDSVVMDQDVGDGHRYNWVATPPAGVTLSPSDGITTAFTAIQAGDYLVRLTVTDNGGLSASAMVTVRVGVEDSAGICGRTQQVQDRILSSSSVFRDGDGYFNREDCDEVTPAELASVSILFLRNGVLSGEDLQPGDFQGLSGLLQLALSRNGFTTLPDGIFSELVSLKHLGLSNNELTSLPDGIFSGLGNLRYLGLWNNELTTLPDGIFSDLTLLKYLALESNRLTSLSGGAFTGLTSLKELVLNGNGLSSLSADVFTGLVSLQDLLLHDNALMNLPAGVFTGLDSLRRLNLSGNPSLTNLEAGVFDDVLDTLRSLYLDDVLKGTVSFSAPAAGLAPGATVMVSVQLDRALPARVRVPYSVSFDVGAAGDFDGLADGALDFNAGETSRAVRVTASETATPGAVANLALGAPVLLDSDGNANTHFNVNNALAGVHRVLNRHTLIVSDASAPSEVIEFTADDAGNAVDGTAIDLLLILNRPALVGTTVTIPYTIAATGGVVANDIADADADGDGNPLTGRIVVNPGSNAGRFTIAAAADFRPNGMKTFTVSLGPLPAGLSLAGGEDGVAAYTVSDICGRTRQVRDAIVQAVAAAAACGDVTPAHLAGITSLNIGSTRLQTLQAGDFAGLTNLVELSLNGNGLTSLPDDVFSSLTGLQELNLEGSQLTELPAGIFNGLTNLRELRLRNNSLTDLPTGVFTGLTSLEDLRLRGNSTLASLPAGVFSGLAGLEYLDLTNSGLTSLPDDVFSGLTGLETLLLSGNDPAIFPIDAFADLTSLKGFWWALDSGFPDGLFDDVLDTLVQLIVSNEIRSALSFDQSAAELGQNAPVEVDVTLSRALPAAVRVSYALSFGGGADASHFSDDAGGMLTFSAGQTRTSVTVRAMANAPVDGTARLTLGAPVLLDGDGEASPLHASALVVEGPTQTHTITVIPQSEDLRVSVAGGEEITEGGEIVFTVTLESTTVNPVSIPYAIAGIDDGDVAPAAAAALMGGTVLIAAGTSSTELHLATTADGFVEGTETAVITLGQLPAGLSLAGASSASVSIGDSDRLSVSLSAADYSIAEDAGSVEVAVLVRSASNNPVTLVNFVTVSVATENGAAMAGEDYTALNETVTILPGMYQPIRSAGNRIAIEIEILNNTIVEPDDESFGVVLTTSDGRVTLGTDEATVTIDDNDVTAVLSPVGAAALSVSAGETTMLTVTTAPVLEDGETAMLTLDVSGVADVSLNPAQVTLNGATTSTAQVMVVAGLQAAQSVEGVAGTVRVTVADGPGVHVNLGESLPLEVVPLQVAVTFTETGIELIAGEVRTIGFEVSPADRGTTQIRVAFDVAGGSGGIAVASSVTVAEGATTGNVTVAVGEDVLPGLSAQVTVDGEGTDAGRAQVFGTNSLRVTAVRDVDVVLDPSGSLSVPTGRSAMLTVTTDGEQLREGESATLTLSVGDAVGVSLSSTQVVLRGADATSAQVELIAELGAAVGTTGKVSVTVAANSGVRVNAEVNLPFSVAQLQLEVSFSREQVNLAMAPRTVEVEVQPALVHGAEKITVELDVEREPGSTGTITVSSSTVVLSAAQSATEVTITMTDVEVGESATITLTIDDDGTNVGSAQTSVAGDLRVNVVSRDVRAVFLDDASLAGINALTLAADGSTMVRVSTTPTLNMGETAILDLEVLGDNGLSVIPASVMLNSGTANEQVMLSAGRLAGGTVNVSALERLAAEVAVLRGRLEVTVVPMVFTVTLTGAGGDLVSGRSTTARLSVSPALMNEETITVGFAATREIGAIDPVTLGAAGRSSATITVTANDGVAADAPFMVTPQIDSDRSNIGNAEVTAEGELQGTVRRLFIVSLAGAGGDLVSGRSTTARLSVSPALLDAETIAVGFDVSGMIGAVDPVTLGAAGRSSATITVTANDNIVEDEAFTVTPRIDLEQTNIGNSEATAEGSLQGTVRRLFVVLLAGAGGDLVSGRSTTARLSVSPALMNEETITVGFAATEEIIRAIDPVTLGAAGRSSATITVTANDGVAVDAPFMVTPQVTQSNIGNAEATAEGELQGTVRRLFIVSLAGAGGDLVSGRSTTARLSVSPALLDAETIAVGFDVSGMIGAVDPVTLGAAGRSSATITVTANDDIVEDGAFTVTPRIDLGQTNIGNSEATAEGSLQGTVRRLFVVLLVGAGGDLVSGRSTTARLSVSPALMNEETITVSFAATGEIGAIDPVTLGAAGRLSATITVTANDGVAVDAPFMVTPRVTQSNIGNAEVTAEGELQGTVRRLFIVSLAGAGGDLVSGRSTTARLSVSPALLDAETIAVGFDVSGMIGAVDPVTLGAAGRSSATITVTANDDIVEDGAFTVTPRIDLGQTNIGNSEATAEGSLQGTVRRLFVVLLAGAGGDLVSGRSTTARLSVSPALMNEETITVSFAATGEIGAIDPVTLGAAGRLSATITVTANDGVAADAPFMVTPQVTQSNIGNADVTETGNLQGTVRRLFIVSFSQETLMLTHRQASSPVAVGTGESPLLTSGEEITVTLTSSGSVTVIGSPVTLTQSAQSTTITIRVPPNHENEGNVGGIILSVESTGDNRVFIESDNQPLQVFFEPSRGIMLRIRVFLEGALQ